MGTITHEWIGTTLVITSDSGTSSCDLKGKTGDMGVRGAQGACGVVYDTEGNILNTIFITREEFEKSAGSFGKTDTICSLKDLHYAYANPTANIQTKYINFDRTGTISYRFKITYEDETMEIIDTVLTEASGIFGADISEKSNRLNNILVNPTTGEVMFMNLQAEETEFIEELEISLTSGEAVYVPFEAQLIPIDNESIKIIDGKLSAKQYINTAVAEAIGSIGIAEEGVY